jgi:hypothetical protein
MDLQGHNSGSRGRQPARIGQLGLRVGIPALLCGMALSAGCVTLGGWLSTGEEPPRGPVCQVVATWHNEVVMTPDPAHNGNPTPGIAGRIYLFGPTVDFPKAGDGSILVDLFDETHATAEQPAKLLEEWRVDRITLQRLLRRDVIGWGYTIFLPWGTCRPEITRIRLKLRYEPAAGGAPLYAESSAMPIKHGDTIPTITAGRGVRKPEENREQLAKQTGKAEIAAVNPALLGKPPVPAANAQLPGYSN